MTFTVSERKKAVNAHSSMVAPPGLLAQVPAGPSMLRRAETCDVGQGWTLCWLVGWLCCETSLWHASDCGQRSWTA